MFRRYSSVIPDRRRRPKPERPSKAAASAPQHAGAAQGRPHGLYQQHRNHYGQHRVRQRRNALGDELRLHRAGRLMLDERHFYKRFQQIQHHICRTARRSAQNVLCQCALFAPLCDQPGQKADEKLCQERHPALGDVQRIGKIEQHAAKAGGKAACQRPEQQAGQRAEHVAQMNAAHVPYRNLNPAEHKHQRAQKADNGQLPNRKPIACLFHTITPLTILPRAPLRRLRSAAARVFWRFGFWPPRFEQLPNAARAKAFGAVDRQSAEIF